MLSTQYTKKNALALANLAKFAYYRQDESNIAEDLQLNPWVTKTTGEGGAGFDSQWDAAFVHPIRDAIVPPNDDFRNMWAVRDAIVNAYKFENGSGSGVSQTRFGQTHDTSVTAWSIYETMGDIVKKDLNSFFVS